jgi:YfiH family protein
VAGGPAPRYAAIAGDAARGGARRHPVARRGRSAASLTMPSPHPDWIVPEWPAPANVRALITTRAGGASRGPFASFNVGLRTGDDPQAVAANRARLRAILPAEPRWLRQVHGTRVAHADTPAGTAPEADAAVSRRPGTVCVVMVADCVPVLLADRAGSCVAVAHAGWRGLAAGIIESTVNAMAADPCEVLAFLGPGIGPGAFEVGPEVREAFLARDPQAESAFAACAPGKWRADLFQLARQRLQRAGVTSVHGGGQCTFSDAARFFSYRRDRTTGRMAAVIWRVEHA